MHKIKCFTWNTATPMHKEKAVTIKLPPYPALQLLNINALQLLNINALQLLNINAVRQSRVYHFLFLCKHFCGVYGCNIIEHVKPSEIA